MKEKFEIQATWPIDHEYSIAQVDKFPHEEYMALFSQHMLTGHPILPWENFLSEEQKEKQLNLKNLIKDRFRIRLALFHKEQFIGWSYGWQDSVHAGDFYVGSSLVIPEHRGRGLYSEMVKKMLELTSVEGFSAIRSRHICTNNPILVAKLKLGFMINGFEQDDIMGTLVRMIYHHDQIRKESAQFRAGKYSGERMKNIFHC